MSRRAQPKRRQRRQWFTITGYMPNADHVLSTVANSKREAVSQISFLLENHPKVTFVEILRYRSEWQSEQEIREAVGHSLRSHDVGDTSPKFGPDGSLLH